MSLSVLEPEPTWDPEAYADTVAAFEALAADEAVLITVWCRDNCPDCRREMPALGAALEAAGFPGDRLREIAVDDDKEGDLVDEYGVEYIPTVVIERDGTELARFVEEEALPAPEYLAEQLR